MSVNSEADDVMLELTTLVLNEPWPVVMRYLAGVSHPVLAICLAHAVTKIQQDIHPRGTTAAEAAEAWRRTCLAGEAGQ